MKCTLYFCGSVILIYERSWPFSSGLEVTRNSVTSTYWQVSSEFYGGKKWRHTVSESGWKDLSLASSIRISSRPAHWLAKAKFTTLSSGAVVKGRRTRISLTMEVSVIGWMLIRICILIKSNLSVTNLRILGCSRIVISFRGNGCSIYRRTNFSKKY